METEKWPRWLSLEAATDYASIGKDRLKALASGGKIRGFRDTDTKSGKWIFDKESIDAYRMAQAEDQELSAKLVDIRRRAGL